MSHKEIGVCICRPVWGVPNPEMFKVYIDYTKQMFQILDFDVVDVHIIAGMRNESAKVKAGLPAILQRSIALLTSQETYS